MPRILKLDQRVSTEHGVLIRRQAVAEQSRAFVTVREARAHACRVVKRAQTEAELLRKQAIEQGFQAGWVASLDEVYRLLQDSAQHYGSLETQLKKEVQQSLVNALHHPDLELMLIDGWLKSSPPHHEKLTIRLPQRAKMHTAAIVQRVLEMTGVVPIITLVEGDDTVISYGNQLVEFSPTRSLTELQRLADDCVHRLDVKHQSAAWSQQAIAAWLNKLELVPPSLTDTAEQNVC